MLRARVEYGQKERAFAAIDEGGHIESIGLMKRAKRAVKNGLFYGNGLGYNQMNQVAVEYSVTGKWIGRDGEAVAEALESGILVIAHMRPGLFTKNGHYIILRGVTEVGKILVNDPNSKSNSTKAFPLRTILREAKTSEPFMLCTVPEPEPEMESLPAEGPLSTEELLPMEESLPEPRTTAPLSPLIPMDEPSLTMH